MPRRVTGLFAILAIASLAAAQEKEKVGPELPSPPAVLELLLPDGATATADGKEVDDPRQLTISDLKPTETRRVKVEVKFADGVTDERLVDLSAGQRLPIAIPRPGP